MAKNSKLRLTYPRDYELQPYDRAREYAWHAHIPPLNIEEIEKFTKEFDWDKISDYDKSRNALGVIREYKKNEDYRVLIKPTVPGFKEEHAYIEIKEYPKNFDAVDRIKPLPYHEIKTGIFPTTKVFKNL